MEPAGSPAARAERIRRAAELPQRSRSPVVGSPRTPQNAPITTQRSDSLFRLPIGLQLDPETVLINAVNAGVTRHEMMEFTVDFATPLVDSSETPIRYRREHGRSLAVRRLLYGDESLLDVLSDVTQPEAPPSDAHVEALRNQLEEWVGAGRTRDNQVRRQQALDEIVAAYQRGYTRLELGDMRLDCLPDCLGLLTTVQHLDISDNRLSELPQNLPPNLLRIAASGNRLEYFPGNLPSTVTDVDFRSNRLRSMPTMLHEGLVGLDVSENALQTMPESLPASLRHARFNDNPIAEIPRWAYFMRPNTRLLISIQPLSAQSTHDAVTHFAARARGDWAGPELLFSDLNPYPELGQGDSAQLLQVALTHPAPTWQWELNAQNELESTAPGSTDADWRSRLGAESSDNRPLFINLINELQRTAEYLHPDLCRPFCTRVATLLRQLETDRSGRELCFAIAENWSGTCEDGVALAFENMQMALRCAEVERGKLSTIDLVTLGHQMMRYEALEQFTLALPGAEHMDLTEAALYLRTALKDELDLPTNCTVMTYGEFARRSCLVSQDTINAARAHVQQQTGGERLVDYLANWQPWLTKLKLDHPQRAAQVAQSNRQQQSVLTEQMEALDGIKEQMGSGDYANAAKALANKYNTIDGFDAATRRELTIVSIALIAAEPTPHSSPAEVNDAHARAPDRFIADAY